MNIQPVLELFSSDAIQVINIGLELFAETLAGQDIMVVHVAWQPPASGDEELMNILSLMGD